MTKGNKNVRKVAQRTQQRNPIRTVQSPENGMRPADNVRMVRYTYELAAKVLEDPRIKNRTIREARVERYAQDMRNLHWQDNGETLKFDRNGVLLDGQHRLWAVVESGMTVEMMTAYQLEPDVITTIDTGAPRAFKDVAAIRGFMNTSVLAASARWLWWYLDGMNGAPNAGRATHAELQRVVDENPDLYERCQELAGSKARKILAPGVLVFVYTLAYRHDRQKAAEWVKLLETGADMSQRHPVYQLRERLLANRTATLKLQPLDVCAMAAKSWVYYDMGRQVAALRWAKTEPFPKLG